MYFASFTHKSHLLLKLFFVFCVLAEGSSNPNEPDFEKVQKFFNYFTFYRQNFVVCQIINNYGNVSASNFCTVVKKEKFPNAEELCLGLRGITFFRDAMTLEGGKHCLKNLILNFLINFLIGTSFPVYYKTIMLRN